ncbi:AEC family transporter [Corticibacter populi]|uniref:AEC family transporter n=1 Tax=Corticibacter populi TaxID=1550736 RepID=A0A3M6R0V3_9BURK|nr:AEC family transporter [Corticibacter populi]RMX08894.1 AEC family transporter [Corticibacter populi]
MSDTISIIFPVFGLILAGVVCRRLDVLGPAAASELNRFVVWLALPAMLFLAMAQADWQALYQPGFIATVALGGLGLFALVAAVQWWRGGDLAGATMDALTGAYPNSGYMGFPLMLLLFGDAALVPTTIMTVLVVCVMFACAILLIELARQRQAAQQSGAWMLVWKVGGALLRNPLILAPLAGVAVAALGGRLPAAGTAFLGLLAAAASPCALVSLGLFLAQHMRQTETAVATETAAVSAPARSMVWMLVAVKLLLQPLLTWLLAAHVFRLPLPQAQMATILAALPTGTGPYMLADLYGRDGTVAARTILISTVASVLTVSALVAWVRSGA